MRRAAFGQRQTEIRRQFPYEISGEADEVRQDIGAEDLKEELFEGRVALPDDLLIFLDRNGDFRGPGTRTLVAAP